MVIPEEILIAIHKFMTICCVQPEKKKKENVSVAGNIPEKNRMKKGFSFVVCGCDTERWGEDAGEDDCELGLKQGAAPERSRRDCGVTGRDQQR